MNLTIVKFTVIFCGGSEPQLLIITELEYSFQEVQLPFAKAVLAIRQIQLNRPPIILQEGTMLLLSLFYLTQTNSATISVQMRRSDISRPLIYTESASKHSTNIYHY